MTHKWREEKITQHIVDYVCIICGLYAYAEIEECINSYYSFVDRNDSGYDNDINYISCSDNIMRSVLNET